MPTFLLAHRHEPAESRHAYAAWLDFESPLRHQRVEGRRPDAAFALVLLPPYVAARSTGEPIRELPIP